MKKVLGIGAAVLDTIIEMDSYPKEDIKIKADNVFKTGGGPVSNALVCLAKLGIEAGYAGILPNNSDGIYLRDEFNRYGVDTKHVHFANNKSAFTSYIILNKTKGTRTCIFDRGDIENDPNLVSLDDIDQYSILHLDGNALPIAKKAIEAAKASHVKISLDAGTLYPGVDAILSDIDILIASEDFARTLTKESDLAKAVMIIHELHHPEILVVTAGKEGGYYLDNDEVHHYNAYRVEAVDTNGAGDTFHGAFLYAYLNGYTIQEACRFASATSALKCQKAGMRDALPTKEEITAFINKGEILC